MAYLAYRRHRGPIPSPMDQHSIWILKDVEFGGMCLVEFGGILPRRHCCLRCHWLDLPFLNLHRCNPTSTDGVVSLLVMPPLVAPQCNTRDCGSPSTRAGSLPRPCVGTPPPAAEIRVLRNAPSQLLLGCSCGLCRGNFVTRSSSLCSSAPQIPPSTFPLFLISATQVKAPPWSNESAELKLHRCGRKSRRLQDAPSRRTSYPPHIPRSGFNNHIRVWQFKNYCNSYDRPFSCKL